MRKRTSRMVAVATVALALALCGAACTPQAQEASSPDAEEQVTEPAQEDAAEEPQDAAEDAPAEEPQGGDPADAPYATLTYEADGQIQTAYPLTCSSTWTFEQDGERMTVTTDAPHPVQYAADGMPAVEVFEPTEVTVSFEAPAVYVDATRYLEEDITAAAEAAGSVHSISASDVTGEIIDAQIEDGAVRLTVEPGYRYALEVSFEDGIAMYVFTVPAA